MDCLWGRKWIFQYWTNLSFKFDDSSRFYDKIRSKIVNVFKTRFTFPYLSIKKTYVLHNTLCVLQFPEITSKFHITAIAVLQVIPHAQYELLLGPTSILKCIICSGFSLAVSIWPKSKDNFFTTTIFFFMQR